VSRREFFALAAAATALAACDRDTSPVATRVTAATVLFQGDSITDDGRDRSVTAPNAPAGLGAGYPLLVSAGVLGAPSRGAWSFYNRGVSGNTMRDLAARWEADTLALRPSVLSVLIGVNDYWHARDGSYTGTLADYESEYAAILLATQRALPEVRLLVLEPFVLRCGVVNDSWFPGFDERRKAAARVARRVGATWVPLQEAFDEVASRTGPEWWSVDGVHPTLAGHRLIAERWRAAFRV
jgi:lysophospholipase L1-like esterase